VNAPARIAELERQLHWAHLKIQSLEEQLRQDRIQQLGPKSETLSNLQLALLTEEEPGTTRDEVEAEARREALFTGLDVPAKPTIEDAMATCDPTTLDLIASFQHAVVGDLMKKTFAAAEALDAERILVTGGVAANRELRERFTAEAARRRISVSFPTLALSTDNAAMIAAAAWPRLAAGEFASADLTADPSLALGR